MEVLSVKQRWGAKEKEANPDETLLERKVRKDEERREREPLQDGRNVSFAMIRPTQLRYNKTLMMPGPRPRPEEATIENQRLESVRVFRKFLSDNNDDRKTLTDLEDEGRQQIKKGIKELGWMVYKTDKSDCLVLDTKENYLECMKPHFEGDREVSKDELIQMEKSFNLNSKGWSKILRLCEGSSSNGNERACQASISKFSAVVPLNGLRKDHKAVVPGEESKGPALRPWSDAKNGADGPVCDILENPVTVLANVCCEKEGKELISTEELCSKIERCNQTLRWETSQKRVSIQSLEPGAGVDSESSPRRPNLKVPTQTNSNKSKPVRAAKVKANQMVRDVVGKSNKSPLQNPDELVFLSMDAKALYPSVTKELASESIKEGVKMTDLEWDLNSDTLIRFASLVLPEEVKEGETMREILPRPKRRTTLNSFLNPSKQARENGGVNQFCPPARRITKDEIKMVLGETLACTVASTMGSHCYKIGGTIRNQGSGGIIGSGLTTQVSRKVMCNFDVRFEDVLKYLKLVMKLYGRYVDDSNVAMFAINYGWKYNKVTNKMEYDASKVEEDKKIKPDVFTATIMRDIANTVMKEIQWTFDAPSLNSDGKCPCLDLKVWIEDGLVMFEFYKKDVSSPYVVMAKSALSVQTKRSSLISEAMRRLLNCSVSLPWGVKARHLSKFAHSMMISGYGHWYRWEVVNGAIKKYEEMVRDRPLGLHRSGEEIRASKRAKIGGGADNWFISERTSNVLPVPITKGGNLKRSLERVVEDNKGPDGGYTKIVEKGGDLISKGLGPMSDTQGCEYAEQGGACLVTKGTCTRSKVCYRIICRICDERLELDINDRVFKKDNPSCNFYYHLSLGL